MCYLAASSLKLSVIIFVLLLSAPARAQMPNLSTSADPRNVDIKRNPQPPAKSPEPEIDYAAEVAGIKRQLQVKPDDPLLYNNLGISYAHLKLYEESLEALRRAVELDPTISSFYYNLSIVYFHLNRPVESLDAARRSLELNPQNTLANIQLCETKLVLRKLEEASACYENLTVTDSMGAISYSNYGYSLIYTKKLKKAIAVLERAAQLFPDEPLVQNNLGMALFEKKQHKKAIVAFKRAIELDSEFTPARFNLALAELENKNKTAAIKQYFIIENFDRNLARQLYKLIYADKVVFLEDVQNSKDKSKRSQK